MVTAGPADKPFRMQISQRWIRLDGSHDDETPVPNRHIVSLDFWRTDLDLAYAVNPRWDAELSVPYEVKQVRARYELPDGTPFDNPNGNLHHRDEVLKGFSDFSLYSVRRFSGEGGRHRAYVGFGTSIPVGKTEEDPYRLGNQGLKHQHIQFGTGTFNPLFKAGYTLEGPDWGWDASLGGRFPFYENRHRYEGAVEYDFSIGSRWKFSERASAGLHYVGIYQERARWDSATDPNSGFFLQGVQFSLPVTLSPSTVLIPSVLHILDVRTRGEGDAFKMDFMLGLAFAKAF